MRVEAIVVAGGSGKRMGGVVRKQYMLLNGLPIIIHTIKAILRLNVIERFVIVAPPDACDATRDLLEAHVDFPDWVVVAGGDERQHSVRSGLQAVSDAAHIVVVHDAVRPLVDKSSTMEVVKAANEVGAATVAVPMRETVKRVADGWVIETIARDQLWAVQTPQAFKLNVLRDAHQAALTAGYMGTDDASLVERIGGMVRIVEGSPINMKVTTPSDLLIVQTLLKMGE